MEEVWKCLDFLGYPKHYVSNLGNFRGPGGWNLKQWPNHGGYLQVSFKYEGKQKHFKCARVVALAFIPNPQDKPEVHHKDDNRQNNRVDNLEWVTRKQNMYHTRISQKARYLK